MSLTPEQIIELRRTWAALSGDREAFAECFYETLFRIAPDVKTLFANSDMAAQGRKLVSAIGLAARHAGNLAPVVPALEELGRRHVEYGVENGHYDAVGRALISAIAERLEPDFSESARGAWAAAYTAVASAMKTGVAATVKKSA